MCDKIRLGKTRFGVVTLPGFAGPVSTIHQAGYTRIVGSALRGRTKYAQETEAKIRGLVVNRITEFGMPNSVAKSM
ncbi:MAG: hypothetical protein ACI9OJ_005612 [Myxococcota bacterium]|jgi:hypothetical protein